MDIIPASEGFLDFFKKKSKEPSKIEKSNINDQMKPVNPLIEINQKLMEIYPEDAAKEFKKRKAFLKQLLNALIEAKKKFKDSHGISFDRAIDILKSFIQEKDNITNDEYYENFYFMNDCIPCKLPEHPNDEYYGYNSQWECEIFEYDLYEWANRCKYKTEFDTNKRSFRNFEDTKEFWDNLNSIDKYITNKFNNSEFMYSLIADDWDEGAYYMCLKPSNEFQQLAARCSSYKPF